MAWVLPRPRLVLGIAVVSAVLSFGYAVTHLEVETDQLELISTHHPLITLSDKLDTFEPGGEQSLSVVIEAPSPERGISFLLALVHRIKEDTLHFENVFYRVDPDLFKHWAFLYLDKQDLLYLQHTLQENSAMIHGLAADATVPNFLKLVNDEMARRMVGELFTGFLDEEKSEEGSDNSGGTMDLEFLLQTLEGLSGYLKGTSDYKSPWASFFTKEKMDLSQEGYFWEGNKRFLIVSVIPKKVKGTLTKAQDALDHLRRFIRETRVSYPDVQAGVTGQEALNNDEMSTVLEDMERATWISLLGVWILMVVFRGGSRRPLIQMVSLGIGLCWTFGWATLFIGHLNMLSVVFAPLLIGLGVDYGIHWFSRFEEEERLGFKDRRSIIRRVMECSGPGIFLAGLSTSLTFLAFVLTGFRGLMELGLITGFGTILNLLADFTILPAMSIFLAGKPGKTFVLKPVSDDGKRLIHLNPKGARLLLACVVVLCLASLGSASRVKFDLNPLRLQAENAEAVVWEKRLMENSQRSLLSCASFASSPEEAKAKIKAFKELPTVSDVESVFSLLPENQDEKLAILRSLLPEIPRVQSVPAVTGIRDIERLKEVLERIRFKMQEDQADQWGADAPVLEQMARVRVLTGEVVRELQDSPEALKRLAEYQKRFQEDLADTLNFVRSGADAPPMTIADIPADLRDRFYQGNEYLIQVFPRESIWEEGALARFIKSLQGVDPQVVGDPVSLYVFSSAFKRACFLASLYAIVAISLLLALSFRKLGLALLALVPLVIGTIWTVGIMGLVGVDFNLANSIFMPLIVGAGVEYGVVILHRWKEGGMRPGDLPLSTAKGVILAALTTTVGFGTLMLSHHRGIFSLGFVACVGSLCVLIAAIIILPALLAGLVPRKMSSRKEI